MITTVKDDDVPILSVIGSSSTSTPVAMVLVVVVTVIVVAQLNEPGWTPCGTPQALELELFGSAVGSHRAHSLLKRSPSDNNHSTGS